MRQLTRDPFARATLMREVAVSVDFSASSERRRGEKEWHWSRTRHACDWCGRGESERVTLYRYGWEQDGGTDGPAWARRIGGGTALFCSVGCYRAYVD